MNGLHIADQERRLAPGDLNHQRIPFELSFDVR